MPSPSFSKDSSCTFEPLTWGIRKYIPFPGVLESKRNWGTGVRTRLLRCCSSERLPQGIIPGFGVCKNTQFDYVSLFKLVGVGKFNLTKMRMNFFSFLKICILFFEELNKFAKLSGKSVETVAIIFLIRIY